MLKKQGTVYLIVLNSQRIKFSLKCFEKDIIIVSKKTLVIMWKKCRSRNLINNFFVKLIIETQDGHYLNKERH